MGHLKLYLLCVCLITPFYAIAEVEIFAIDIPGLHQKDGGGSYDKIIVNALSDEIKNTILVLPGKRALLRFSRCQNCCYTPSNINPNFYHHSADTVATAPMNIAKIYIFTPRGQPTISNLSELSNKVVGIRRGMNYGQNIINADLNFVVVNTLKQNFKKMDRGRLDAVIAYSPDVVTYFTENILTAYPHNIKLPIGTHFDGLVCRGVSDQFIQSFNNGLTLLRKSGELEKMLNLNNSAFPTQQISNVNTHHINDEMF